MNPLPLIALGVALLAAKTPASPRGTSGFGAISRDDMQAIQYDLAYLGYYHGVVNGLWGDDTRLAIRSFQDDHGLEPADGKPGRDTLTALDNVMDLQP